MREMRIFERNWLLRVAELKADLILRGATIQGARRSYLLRARKEVRIVKNNER